MIREKRDILFARIIQIYTDVETVIEEIGLMTGEEKILCYQEAKPLFDLLANSADLLTKTYIPMLKYGADEALYADVEGRVEKVMVSIASVAQEVGARVS